ncbi:MAG: Coenzyme F420 hydrogenase/dehydrogenase, beta subunit C-terminal domain [Anaerolineaceae bacterium]
MSINRAIDNALKTRWTGEQIQKYIGPCQASYFSYAKNRIIRSNAASGGTTTAILQYLLKSKMVDGALVCKAVVEEGQVRARFFVATTPEELTQAQGSKYISTRFSNEAMPLIRAYQGKLAVVTLPCDAKLLRLVCEHNPALAKKVVCIITLFCGHLSEPALTKFIINKLKPDKDAVLKSFRYRFGHWRGHLMAEFTDGQVICKKFSFFSKYQNLYYFCERKCLHCYDHAGYHADISVGDIWLQRMKDDPIKHSALIAKTHTGHDLILKAAEAGDLVLDPQPIQEIVEAQSRSFKIHYNISARAKAGKNLGEKIDDPVHEKVRWSDYLVAYTILKNYQLTQTEEGRQRVVRMSKNVIKLRLYALKALEIL